MNDNLLTCIRCSFTWHSSLLANRGIMPKECPRCKSMRWEIPKKIPGVPIPQSPPLDNDNTTEKEVI